MQITSKTLYAELLPIEDVLTAESVQALKAAAEREFKPCYELTIDEFFGIQAGNLSLLGDTEQPTALQVYWCKRYKEFCDEFAAACEQLAIKDAEHDKLHNGCKRMTTMESMLTFVRDYFGLPSFMAAGERTLGEYLLARKDRYNQWRVQKNMIKAQQDKLKTRRR